MAENKNKKKANRLAMSALTASMTFASIFGGVKDVSAQNKVAKDNNNDATKIENVSAQTNKATDGAYVVSEQDISNAELVPESNAIYTDGYARNISNIVVKYLDQLEKQLANADLTSLQSIYDHTNEVVYLNADPRVKIVDLDNVISGVIKSNPAKYKNLSQVNTNVFKRDLFDVRNVTNKENKSQILYSKGNRIELSKQYGFNLPTTFIPSANRSLYYNPFGSLEGAQGFLQGLEILEKQADEHGGKIPSDVYLQCSLGGKDKAEIYNFIYANKDKFPNLMEISKERFSSRMDADRLDPLGDHINRLSKYTLLDPARDMAFAFDFDKTTSAYEGELSVENTCKVLADHFNTLHNMGSFSLPEGKEKNPDAVKMGKGEAFTGFYYTDKDGQELPRKFREDLVPEIVCSATLESPDKAEYNKQLALQRTIKVNQEMGKYFSSQGNGEMAKLFSNRVASYKLSLKNSDYSMFDNKDGTSKLLTAGDTIQANPRISIAHIDEIQRADVKSGIPTSISAFSCNIGNERFALKGTYEDVLKHDLQVDKTWYALQRLDKMQAAIVNKEETRRETSSYTESNKDKIDAIMKANQNKTTDASKAAILNAQKQR